MARPKRARRMGVYVIEDTVTGWAYIGSSKDLEARQRRHWRLYGEERGHNKALQYAWLLHGDENFTFSVLEECSEEQLSDRERHHIASWGGRLFNILRDGRRIGAVTPETRAILSDRAKAQHAAGTLGRKSWREQ
jgi:group I intron endonuclease